LGAGAIVPGGVRGEGPMALDELLAELDQLERDLRREPASVPRHGIDDRPLIAPGVSSARWSRTTAPSGRSRAGRVSPPTLAMSGPTVTTAAWACGSSRIARVTRWRG